MAPIQQKQLSRRLVALVLPILLVLTVGCGGDEMLDPPEPVSDRELYWALELNHHAVLMSSANSLYDTLTLVATPRNRFGEMLPTLGAPRFTSPNPEQLLVSPTTGQLIAKQPTSEPLPVIASLSAGNLRHEDTAYVIIVAEPAPPRLASFSAHPAPSDSTKLGAQSWCFGCGSTMYAELPALATDSNGNAITGLPVYLRSSDARVLTISTPLNGKIHGVRPGAATIYASTTAFGIAKTDTIPYRIGWPVAQRIEVHRAVTAGASYLTATTLTVGPGALVIWQDIVDADATPDTLELTFRAADVPRVTAGASYGAWDRFFGTPERRALFLPLLCGASDCGDGNVKLPEPGVAFRVFPTPGTYEYSLPRHGGLHGRIVVVDEATAAAD